jgi:hypothetical protein
MSELKVGDTAEVIEVLDSFAPILYENGSWGTIAQEFNTDVSAFLGPCESDDCGWYVLGTDYRRVGRLTITKLK